MTHPKLPGQEIDVHELSVGSRSTSGWIEADEPATSTQVTEAAPVDPAQQPGKPAAVTSRRSATPVTSPVTGKE